MDKKYCPYCMSLTDTDGKCPACGLSEGNYIPAPHHIPPGTILLDRYLVGRVLGEGGFGITYIGFDLRLELKVAIKEFFPNTWVSRDSKTSLSLHFHSNSAGRTYEKSKKKFLFEAQTMAKMEKQPEIVTVREFFELNNTAYIVMEYVEGVTFKELAKQRGGRIPAAELLDILEPLFPALRNLHALNLIHRDISPDNLMLENGSVRLIDFGSVRESSKEPGTLTIDVKHGFAPYEQYVNKDQGAWTDVYALSATIYFCLTGKIPVPAVERIEKDELIPPRQLGVELTEQQEKALLYGMGILKKDRFHSMEEMHACLYKGAEVPDKKTSGPKIIDDIPPTSMIHMEVPADPGSEKAEGTTVPLSTTGTSDHISEEKEGKTVPLDSTDTPEPVSEEKEEKTVPLDSTDTPEPVSEEKGGKTVPLDPGDSPDQDADGTEDIDDSSDQKTDDTGDIDDSSAQKADDTGDIDDSHEQDDGSTKDDGDDSSQDDDDTDAGDDGDSSQDTGDTKKPKNRFLYAGIAAAVVLVVLLCVLIPKIGKQSSTPASSAPSSPALSEDSAEEPAQETQHFAETETARDDEELCTMLESDEVKEVRLSADFSGAIDSPLTISKQVVIPEGLKIDINNLFLLSGEDAQLEVAGEPTFSGYGSFLATEKGAKIHIAKTGALYLPEENENEWHVFEDFSKDITVDEGGRLENADHIYESEKKMFQKAKTVTSQKELKQAAAKGAAPIIIDSDLELTESISVPVPVLVKENAEITMSGDGYGLVFIKDATLINHGSLGASAVSIGGMSDDIKIFNYGKMELPYSEEGRGSCVSMLYNRGEIVQHGGGYLSVNTNDGHFVNAGSLTFKSSEEDSSAFDLDCSHLNNYGQISVEAEALFNTEMRNNGNTNISGTLRIGKRTRIEDGSGTFHLFDGGELEMSGILKMDDVQSLEMDAGSTLSGDGFVCLWDGSAEDFPADTGLTIRSFFGTARYETEVSTADQFLNALQTDTVDTVIVTKDITVDGGILMRKNLEIADGATLTVDELRLENVTCVIDGGGTLKLADSDSRLTVSGSSSDSIFMNYGEIYPNYGTIEVVNGALAWFDALSSSDTDLVGSLSVSDNALCCVSLAARGANISVTSGGRLAAQTDLYMDGGTLTVDGGTIDALGGELNDTILHIEKSGQLFAGRDDLRMYVSGYNRGTIDLDGCIRGEISGDFTNYGTIFSRGSAGISYQGILSSDTVAYMQIPEPTILHNQGKIYISDEFCLDEPGTLDNSGQIYVKDGKKGIVVNDGASFTGDTSTLPWEE